MLRRLCGLLAAGLFLTAAQAADRYVLERPHTQILFFADHLGYSQSQGEFHDFEGHFVFDPGDWSTAAVEVEIRTHSVDMDHHAWDKHLRDADFFDVIRFPTMRFVSTRVEPTGEKTALVHGDLSLLGQTRPVTLAVRFNRAGAHPKSGKYVAGFSATAEIKRSDFGMTYGLPHLGDTVALRLEVEGVREGGD